jgi:heme-degrading monooxygenase HmoA
MYTRLITWTNAKNIDGGIEYLRGTALPVIHQQKGYRGLSATVDRSTGRLNILSIWESEADRDASDSALGKARDEATEIIGGSIQVEKLEDLVSEVVSPPVPGSALMVSPFSMDPATIDENLRFFKNEIVPQIKAAPGFCSLRNMVNRKTGEGYVGTVWADRAALDEQAEGAAVARREAASARGITFGEIGYLEFVLVDTP